jgi:hypothetical protein
MLTPYKKSDLVYSDYKWSARADHDNPKFVSGSDYAELNRTEGYEILYFISSLAKTWGWDGYPVRAYNHAEKIIRTEVPSNIRTHSGIKNWISSRYSQL